MTPAEKSRRFDKLRELGCVCCPGIEHAYVNADGDVYSDHPGNRWKGKLHKMTPKDNGRGYLRVRLNYRAWCIHRLVATAFLGPIPEGMEVNHKDGNKTNNRPENLEYVTRSRNMRHAHETGLAVARRGEAHHGAKLTAPQALRLRAEYRALAVNGRLPDGEAKRLAAKYGVSADMPRRISAGESWSCLDPIPYEVTAAGRALVKP